MIVLALDCSLNACSAAVYDSGRSLILAQRFEAMERGQAEAIAPMARDVAIEAQIALSQIDRIAVTLGPGTFTGIRIGLAFAKGLGLTLNKPVIGIDTLRAIAVNADDPARPIAVVTDARHGQVYLGIFKMPDATSLPPRRMTLAEAVTLLPKGALSVMGAAKETLIAAADRHDLSTVAGADLPIAAHFAVLAVDAVPDAGPLRPLYLAESYAKLPRSKIEVTLAHGEDAILLSEIHNACFDPGWSAADLARLIAMPGAVALIAYQSKKPKGFLLIRGAADEAEIITIATLPEMRRQGIGSRLIDTALEFLRQRGTGKLLIEVADSNAAALALYRKFGFVPVGTRRGYYEHADGGREDAAIMRKEIPA